MSVKLVRNKAGRFEFEGIELCSGDCIYLKLGEEFVSGRIEHDDGGYFFTYCRGTELLPAGGAPTPTLSWEKVYLQDGYEAKTD